MPAAKALQYIEENKGRHFDPHVVDAFLSVFDKFLGYEHEILSLTDSEEPFL